MPRAFDPITAFAVLFLLAVMVLTGYLVIYNIFQISVANDIRHYGLLKTIGTTPRQIRALVRWQALALSVGGIPVGLALGYALGAALAPSIQAILSYDRITISRSPWIFLLAAAFSLGTVLLSCARPGRLAGRVSPIEALRYTDAEAPRRKRAARAPRPVYRAAHKAKAPRRGPAGMAAANLRRTPRKTALAVASLALAVGLLQITCALALGFDLDKYLANYVLTDFVLADAGYFKHAGGGGDLTEADIAAVEATGLAEEIGVTTCWYSAEWLRARGDAAGFPRQFCSRGNLRRNNRRGRAGTKTAGSNTVPVSTALTRRRLAGSSCSKAICPPWPSPAAGPSPRCTSSRTTEP